MLAYWEDERAFQAGDEPKGSVPLMRIAKVQHDRSSHSGRSVVVTHVQHHERKDMIILLHSDSEAREFAYKLWELISKVRSKWDDMYPSSLRRAATGPL